MPIILEHGAATRGNQMTYRTSGAQVGCSATASVGLWGCVGPTGSGGLEDLRDSSPDLLGDQLLNETLPFCIVERSRTAPGEEVDNSTAGTLIEAAHDRLARPTGIWSNEFHAERFAVQTADALVHHPNTEIARSRTEHCSKMPPRLASIEAENFVT